MTVFDNPNFKNIQAVNPDPTNSLFLMDALRTFRSACDKGVHVMTVQDFLWFLDENGLYMDSIVKNPTGVALGTVADFLHRVGSMYGLNPHFLDAIEAAISCQREMFATMKQFGKKFNTADLEDMELPFYYMVRAYVAVYNELPEAAAVSDDEILELEDGTIISAESYYNGLVDSNLVVYKQRSYSWRVFQYIRKRGHVSFKALAEAFSGCELSYLIELYKLYDLYAYQRGGSLLLSKELSDYFQALSAYRKQSSPPLSESRPRTCPIFFVPSFDVTQS